MKATGIVRKLDQLGRLVLPKEFRSTHNWPEGTPIEIFVEGEDIILRKYEPFCTFCGESGEMAQLDGKNICRKCVNKIQKL
jgi:transcriptional pleiotropic regulator of transition state genes